MANLGCSVSAKDQQLSNRVLKRNKVFYKRLAFIFRNHLNGDLDERNLKIWMIHVYCNSLKSS